MRLRHAFFVSFALAVAVAGFACTKADPLGTPTGTSFDGGTEPPSKKDATVFDPGEASAPTPDAGAKKGQVYAHTARTLYLFEPYAKQLTKVGDFDCLPGPEVMIDIALNETGAMYGTTSDLATDKGHFVTIDPISAKCTTRGAVDYYPDSLGFVPAGTLDVKEALVGYDGEYYVRVDLDTGKMTDIGTLNPPGPDAGTLHYSSGDIVAIIGDKAYLTANDSADLGDYLLEIDPKTGRRVKVIAPLSTRELWGTGYWGGKIYAFSGAGQVLEVNPVTGAKSTVAQIAVPDGGTGFYGAGVTTLAPRSP